MMLKFKKDDRFLKRVINGREYYSTGVSDTNDVLIYEGDLVENRIKARFVIQWDYRRCGFVAWHEQTGPWDILTLEDKSGPLRVVGNIYEGNSGDSKSI